LIAEPQTAAFQLTQPKKKTAFAPSKQSRKTNSGNVSKPGGRGSLATFEKNK